jgi:hypothetical protein
MAVAKTRLPSRMKIIVSEELEEFKTGDVTGGEGESA